MDWTEEDFNIYEDKTAGYSHYRRPITNWNPEWDKFIGRSAVVKYATKGYSYSQKLFVLGMGEVLVEGLPGSFAYDTVLITRSAGVHEPTLRTYNEGGFVSNDIQLQPLINWLKERSFI